MSRPSVLIVGGGPAGLAAAEMLAPHASVTLVERMPSVGRKLLLAGRGGLNLTHSEPLEPFLGRYGADADWLRPAIEAFSPQDLRDWAEALGQPCFVGSSGRVFPRAMKASPLLRAWLARLAAQDVTIRTRCRFAGFDGASVRLDDADGSHHVAADATLLALGGASWPRLGSDGSWAPILLDAGVALAPFEPANCGFVVGFSALLREKFAGVPLKSVALSFGGATVRGDLVLTATGLEGGAIYSLSAALRKAIAAEGAAIVRLDLRPEQDVSELAARLSRGRGRESLSNRLRKALSLSPAAIALLHEPGPPPKDAGALAALIKSVKLRLTAPSGLDRAISTAGGVRRDAVDARFMLTARPGSFVCGEMLDWEAPTGGYLLQASVATGRAAAAGLLAWLGDRA